VSNFCKCGCRNNTASDLCAHCEREEASRVPKTPLDEWKDINGESFYKGDLITYWPRNDQGSAGDAFMHTVWEAVSNAREGILGRTIKAIKRDIGKKSYSYYKEGDSGNIYIFNCLKVPAAFGTNKTLIEAWLKLRGWNPSND
jgi:hypothetical protein